MKKNKVGITTPNWSNAAIWSVPKFSKCFKCYCISHYFGSSGSYYDQMRKRGQRNAERDTS